MVHMRAGEAVVEALRAEGVAHAFGVVGSSYIEVLDALYGRSDIDFIGTRHEQGASFMALGYARATGRPGVCMATNGPGAVNLVTGIAGAHLAPAPVIAVTGAAMLEHIGRGAIQEIDQVGLLRPITKAAIQLNKAERIPEVFRRAFSIAMSGRKGPVLVDLPRDLLNPQALEVDLWPPERYRPSQRIAPEPELVRQAMEVLSRAQFPVLVAGGGIVEADCAADAVRLAELLSMPMTASYARGDAVPNDHPLYIGPLGRGGAEEAFETVRKADAILALGTRLGHFTMWLDNRYVPADAKIVQVELDSNEIGRHYPVSVGLLADAGVAARMMVEALEAGPQEFPGTEQRLAWASEMRAARARRLERAFDLPDTPINPQRVYAELRSWLPKETIIVLDAGTNSHYGYDGLNFNETRTQITPADFACVGSGYPSALGAKVGRPDRPVLSINGDGGFFMNMQELETAVRHDIGVVAVVMNNNSWGAEKAYQKFLYDERYLEADIGNPRFDKVAELCGARGMYVDRPQDITPAVREALESGKPTVIEIPVDPDELSYPVRAGDVLKERAANQ